MISTVVSWLPSVSMYRQRGNHPRMTHLWRIPLRDRGQGKRGQSVAPRSIKKTIHHYSSACAPPVRPYDFNGWWNEKWLGGQMCSELPASKHNQCLLCVWLQKRQIINVKTSPKCSLFVHVCPGSITPTPCFIYGSHQNRCTVGSCLCHISRRKDRGEESALHFKQPSLTV